MPLYLDTNVFYNAYCPIEDRIVADWLLNQISSEGIGMDFFEKGKFHTITCCYGVNYLDEPVPVFKEFERILSPEGKFLVLGNTASGYSDIQTHCFDPESRECFEYFPQLEVCIAPRLTWV